MAKFPYVWDILVYSGVKQIQLITKLKLSHSCIESNIQGLTKKKGGYGKMAILVQLSAFQ